MARSIGKALLALAIVAVARPSPAAPAEPAPRATATVEHRAAVVVHTGAEVRTACVRFREDSISGKEALERAQMEPVFRAYSGQGTAVCALCGKGCPADDSCLTCGGNNYWSYHRARAGSVTYTPSSGGVSSTRVRDGDVEGWQWGPGTPPPLYSVEQVCPAPEPAPTAGGGGAPASEPSTPTTNQRPAAAAAPTLSLPPSTVAPVLDPSAAPAASTTTAVLVPVSTPPTAATGTATAAGSTTTDDESGTPASLALFAVLLVALAAWAVWAKQRRDGAGRSGS